MVCLYRGHDLATDGSEALARAAAQRNPGNVMLSEKSCTQKFAYCMVPFIGNVQNGRVHRNRKWLPGEEGDGTRWLVGMGFLGGR